MAATARELDGDEGAQEAVSALKDLVRLLACQAAREAHVASTTSVPPDPDSSQAEDEQ